MIPLHRLSQELDDEFKRMLELFEEAKAADLKAWPRYSVEDLAKAVAMAAGSSYAPSGRYRHDLEDRRQMRRLGSDLITRYLGAFRVEDDAASDKVHVTVEENIVREIEALKMLVRVYVIRRPGLAVVQHGQQRVIGELFEAYFKASDRDAKGGDRRILPPATRRMIDEGPNNAAHRARAVVDLIAGLTEQTAVELHRRLYGDGTATALDATAHMA